MIEQIKRELSDITKISTVDDWKKHCRYLIGEVERKDKAIKILTDAMQAINDYSSERATRNESHIALVDAGEILKGGEKNELE